MCLHSSLRAHIKELWLDLKAAKDRYQICISQEKNCVRYYVVNGVPVLQMEESQKRVLLKELRSVTASTQVKEFNQKDGLIMLGAHAH